MKVTGEVPSKVRRVIVEDSQRAVTYHFDDPDNPPTAGIQITVNPVTTPSTMEQAEHSDIQPAPNPSTDVAIHADTRVINAPNEKNPRNTSEDRVRRVVRKRKASTSEVLTPIQEDTDADDFVVPAPRVPPRPVTRSKQPSKVCKVAKRSKSVDAGSSSHQSAPQEGDVEDLVRPAPRVAPRPDTRSKQPSKVGKVGKQSKSVDAGSSSSHQSTPQDKFIARRSPTVRCSPSYVVNAIEVLNVHQIKEIEKTGFGQLLKLKLDALESRDLVVFLLDRTDAATLVIDVGTQGGLKITPHAVHCVLGLPIGGVDPPIFSFQQKSDELRKLKMSLNIPQDKGILFEDLISRIKLGGTDHLTIRCFLLIVFNRLLFPSTATYITGKEAALTSDMGRISSIDWCKVTIDDITDAVLSWHNKRFNKGTLSISSCALFFIVYYLDNLLSLSRLDATNIPRVAYFSTDLILKICNEDKYKKKDELDTYGRLKLRSQEGTCYSSQPTMNPSSSSGAAAMFSSFLPSLRRQLGHCFDDLTPPKQVAAMAALQRCDDEVAKAISDIAASQNKVINELREIMLPSASFGDPPSHVHAECPPPHPSHQPDYSAASASVGHPPTSANAERPSPHPSHPPADANMVPKSAPNISLTQMAHDNLESHLSDSQQGFLIDQLYGTTETQQEAPPTTHATEQFSSRDDHVDDEQRSDTAPHDVHVDYTPIEGPISITQMCEGVEMDGTGCPSCDDDAPMLEESLLDDIRREREEAAALAVEQQVQSSEHTFATEKSHQSPVVGDLGIFKCGLEVSEASKSIDNVINDIAKDTILEQYDNVDVTPIDVGKQLEHSSAQASDLVSQSSGDDFGQATQIWEVSEQLRAARLAPPSHNEEEADVPAPNIIAQKFAPKDTHFTKNNKPKATTTRAKISTKKAIDAASTQNLIIHGTTSPPPVFAKRLRKRPSKLVSPFKLLVSRPSLPSGIPNQLRDVILSDADLQRKLLLYYSPTSFYATGDVVAASFKDGSDILYSFLEYWIDCMRYDEKKLRPNSVGYRIFIRWELSCYLNFDARFPNSKYDSQHAATLVNQHLGETDANDIKLILWVFHHRSHFCVYCVNMAHHRVDVLDSVDWATRGDSWNSYHLPWGPKCIRRLSDAFSAVSRGKIDFSNWPIYTFQTPKQLADDCALFSMKFMEHYDGEENTIRYNIVPGNASQYRCDELFYMLFHPLNESRILPEQLEKFRPASK